MIYRIEDYNASTTRIKKARSLSAMFTYWSQVRRLLSLSESCSLQLLHLHQPLNFLSNDSYAKQIEYKCFLLFIFAFLSFRFLVLFSRDENLLNSTFPVMFFLITDFIHTLLLYFCILQPFFELQGPGTTDTKN